MSGACLLKQSSKLASLKAFKPSALLLGLNRQAALTTFQTPSYGKRRKVDPRGEVVMKKMTH
jgi:hypothetical protein